MMGEAKRARLRFATATDKDLEELANLEARMQGEIPGEIPGLSRSVFEKERLGHLKNDRAKIREKGIKRSELVCQLKHVPCVILRGS